MAIVDADRRGADGPDAADDRVLRIVAEILESDGYEAVALRTAARRGGRECRAAHHDDARDVVRRMRSARHVAWGARRARAGTDTREALPAGMAQRQQMMTEHMAMMQMMMDMMTQRMPASPATQ